MLRFVYRQLAFNPARTTLTTTAIAAVRSATTSPTCTCRSTPAAGAFGAPASLVTLAKRRLSIALNRPVLVPRYDVIGQAGIDLQYTKGAWLWKLKAIGCRGHGNAFTAFVAGVEYTLFNLGESSADLGLLAEYLYDARDDTAPPTLYDDDWCVGFRLAMNDTADTAILGGAIVDASGTFAVLEAERRLAEVWKLEVEARLFLDVGASDPLLGGFQQDSFVTLRIARYL